MVDDADFPLSDKSVNMEEIGHDIHKLAQDLWPLNRSLPGTEFDILYQYQKTFTVLESL